MTYYTDLYHHGIKGQKWGSRNGPPYPLKPGDHSKAEREAESNSKTAFKIDKDTLVTVGKVAAVAALAAVGVVAVKTIHDEGWTAYAAHLNNKVSDIIDSDRGTHQSNDKVQNYFNERKQNGELDSQTGLYKKKREMSSDEDLSLVNPEYETYDKATYNCGLCSMTYDMRRRGYDVTAGFSDDGLGLANMEKFYPGSKRQLLAGNYMKSSANIKTDALTQQQAQQAIATLSEQKSSRGIMNVIWAGRNNGGHAVAYEVDSKGVFRILDGQSNDVYQGYYAIEFLKNASAAVAIRLDNCEPDIQRMIKEGVIR